MVLYIGRTKLLHFFAISRTELFSFISLVLTFVHSCDTYKSLWLDLFECLEVVRLISHLLQGSRHWLLLSIWNYPQLYLMNLPYPDCSTLLESQVLHFSAAKQPHLIPFAFDQTPGEKADTLGAVTPTITTSVASDTGQPCSFCLAKVPHPRLGRGESYGCGYKPYRCEICNYSTVTKGNLAIHEQSDKHLNNVQVPLSLYLSFYIYIYLSMKWFLLLVKPLQVYFLLRTMNFVKHICIGL